MLTLLVVVLLAAACSSSPADTTTSPTLPSTTTTAPDLTTTTLLALPSLLESTTLDGLPIDIYGPSEVGDWPVVVVLHGGGWFGGQPATMAPLAADLASRGMVVFNATYRTAGGGYPESFEDVACAFRFAVETAPRFTTQSRGPVIIGHSAGAHLGSVVALAGQAFGGECSLDGWVNPAGFVGLAGPYDVTRFTLVLPSYFGTRYEVDPTPWEEGSPFFHLEENSELSVLLIHGDEDELIPTEFSQDLALALEQNGYQTTLEILEGANHSGARDPALVGDLIAQFIFP
ncbi:MAG TPA: alpha/beta hydrolase [Acidimicrobiia bacterium]|nr:alpha/beta hydrolase [Acidimicrobiia bacterium]